MCLRCQKRTLFIISLPPDTPGYYTYVGHGHDGQAGKTDAGIKASILSLLCEHIAILVFLVSLFLIILNNRTFFTCIACYVRFCLIVLNVSGILEDMSPTMLIEIHLNPQPSHTPTHSSTQTTELQTPPPYQHPNNNPNAAAKSNPHANRYHPPNDNPY